MQPNTKETYQAPAMLAVELQPEGVVCQSGGLRNYNREDSEEW